MLISIQSHLHTIYYKRFRLACQVFRLVTSAILKKNQTFVLILLFILKSKKLLLKICNHTNLQKTFLQTLKNSLFFLIGREIYIFAQTYTIKSMHSYKLFAFGYNFTL